MTPKEKAKELIVKFYSIGANECQKCAIIAVDLIIEEGLENSVDDFYDDQGYTIDNEDYYVYGYTEFWQQVKTEIEAL
jgi:hypothetical protein